MTSTLVYVLIDGAPVAWIRPKEQQYIIGPPAGRYTISFRDFFGTGTPPPNVTDLPAYIRYGAEPDSGTGR
jgi:hypothetical protein